MASGSSSAHSATRRPGNSNSVTAAAPEDLPIRWWLERPGQKRPCTSVLGLLRSLRNGLGGGEARKLLIV